MFDELERLRECKALAVLLNHYAQTGGDDRDAWQDRVMKMEGVEVRELVKLHGELIAHGWVEQNTGVTPVLKVGVAACCYRITSSGRRAALWVRRARLTADGPEPEAA